MSIKHLILDKKNCLEVYGGNWLTFCKEGVFTEHSIQQKKIFLLWKVTS